MIVIIKHIWVEGLGSFEKFCNESSLPVHIVELEKNSSFPEIDVCCGIISLGGPMNVYESRKYPFLREEESFLSRALNEQVPVLGICLGAQLLAKAAGAAVGKSPREELGLSTVNLTPEGAKDTLLKGLPGQITVFQWHEDTFGIPAGGSLLACSDVCQNQAFKIGRCAWGLQFHPEVTRGMFKEWISFYGREKENRHLMDEYDAKEKVYLKHSGTIMRNFFKFIKKSW